MRYKSVACFKFSDHRVCSRAHSTQEIKIFALDAVRSNVSKRCSENGRDYFNNIGRDYFNNIGVPVRTTLGAF